MADAPWPVSRILVGVDASAGAARAVRWAVRLATSTGAEVVLAHALTYDQELLRDVTPATMHTWRRELDRTIRTTWAAPAIAAGIGHRGQVVEGDSVADALLQTAAKESADLLVIGASDHERVVSRLRGSTVERLVHRAAVPVVVVPPTEREGAAEP